MKTVNDETVIIVKTFFLLFELKVNLPSSTNASADVASHCLLLLLRIRSVHLELLGIAIGS